MFQIKIVATRTFSDLFINDRLTTQSLIT